MTEDEHNQVNWTQIIERMHENPGAAAEAMRARFAARGAEYAAPERSTEVQAATEAVLMFQLGDELYAVPVAVVQSVRTLPRVTRVPGAPTFYTGVVNVRGEIITVLDLRIFLGTDGKDDDPAELIIAEAAELKLGIVASRVLGVVDIPIDAIDIVDSTRFVRGVYGKTLLLDTTTLFSDDRLIVRGGDDDRIS